MNKEYSMSARTSFNEQSGRYSPTGSVVSFFSIQSQEEPVPKVNEIIKETGKIFQGKREGLFLQYFSNGDILKGTYVNGVKSGDWEEKYASGNIFCGKYENDLENGIWTMNFANGTIATGLFVNGVQTGTWTFQYKNGNVATGKVDKSKKIGVWAMQSGGQEFQANFDLESNPKWKSSTGLVGSFHKGLKHGQWLFQPNAVITHTLYFQNDVKNGPYSEVIGNEILQCMFENNKQMCEFKSIGRSGEFYDLEDESGWKINGIKEGFWIEKSEDYVEVGEYINGIRSGNWVKKQF